MEALWAEQGDWRQRRVAYMNAMERLYTQFPKDDEVTAFYSLSLLSAGAALQDDTFRYNMKAGALAIGIVEHNPKHPGATHYIIHAFDDPVHAPLALRAARVYADIVPAVSHAVHMPTHIFIQHGMWNEVVNQNVRAFGIAKDLWEPGDVPGDMAHSGDWGQYGFLQLGDYAGARTRMDLFSQMAETSKHARAVSALALQKARYIIETEEWKVQPMAENASNETILANGMSALRTGDMATAEAMEKRLAAKAPAPSAAAGLHADHGAAPAPAPPAGGGGGGPDAGKSGRIMQKELAALIALRQGSEGSGRHPAQGSRRHRREHAAAKRRGRSGEAVARAAGRSAAAGRQAGRRRNRVRREPAAHAESRALADWIGACARGGRPPRDRGGAIHPVE